MPMVKVAMADSLYDEVLPVPRAARLPIELTPPVGFEPADIRTWPDVVGRLEYVDGRLLYMPPCGEEQGMLVMQMGHLLRRWAERHPGFDVGGNEAGLILGRDVRAADAVVWKRVAPPKRAFSRSPPALAVEIAGRDDADNESALTTKAKAYLRHGVKTVWLVLPEPREVVVVRSDRTRRFGMEDVVPAPAELRGLSLSVAEIFSVL